MQTAAATAQRDPMQVSVPPGASGIWRVERFTVTDKEARHDADMETIRGSRRSTPAGTYTRLMRGPEVVMSDTPDEQRDHRAPVREAHGHCLVFGLGLGMVTAAMLDRPEVSRVTVVEISQDVIRLVAPALRDRYGDRLDVVCADAYGWKPPARSHYGVVWADIWDGICSDNLAGMAKFNRRYARMADWKGCWGEALCRYRRSRERQMGW